MFDPELIKGFVSDSLEMLDEVEPHIIQLQKEFEEKGIVNRETLNEIFRLFHSLKGASAFLGLENINKVMHEAENLLGALREGRINISAKHVEAILLGCDFIRKVLPELQDKGTDKDFEGESRRVIEELRKSLKEPSEEFQEEIPFREAPKEELTLERASPTQKKVKSDIRVDLDKLNELNDLIGELVIAETMVVRNPDLKGYRFENFEKAAHQLHLIISSLQDLALSLRMVPIGGLFRRMIRVAYDTAKRSGKEVELLLKGEETEVDKTVIEAISDPLVHLVRNAVDHGIEPPMERERIGKPRKGLIELEARHEGGEVLIIVKDDGKGLDKESILKKAIERGLIQPGAVLPDEEIFQLIFLPGFSTATEVTEISGRGVGMDVVKSRVEELRGWVEVKSVQGRGTTVILHLPLTLAIIDGLLVRIGDYIYVLPLYAVKELFPLDLKEVTYLPGGKKVIKRHGRLYPVVSLRELLGMRGGKSEEEILVLLEQKGKELCLGVEEVLGQRDTVIKPLPKRLGKITGISGCSILEDGGVCLILDVQGILERVDHGNLQHFKEGGEIC
jgi:two-component system chemotaxis sensor kinase CheA